MNLGRPLDRLFFYGSDNFNDRSSEKVDSDRLEMLFEGILTDSLRWSPVMCDSDSRHKGGTSKWTSGGLDATYNDPLIELTL